jgi:hypothetical protein
MRFRWPNPEKYPLRWISFAIFVKVFYLLLIIFLSRPEAFQYPVQLWTITGDFSDYTEPVERLISEGKYYFGDNNFAGRMPGYTLLLLPLRWIFDAHQALNAVLILQAILSGISCYWLMLIFYRWTGRTVASILVFFAYLLSFYVSAFDGVILTESPAVFCLIGIGFSFTGYVKDLGNELKWAAIAGFFLCWLIFLRPFYIPFCIVLPFIFSSLSFFQNQ